MPTDIALERRTSGELRNRSLRRLISRCSDGRWSLFTYTRPGQETYSFVRMDVPEHEAMAWLRGEDPLDEAKRRAAVERAAARAELEAVLELAVRSGKHRAVAAIREQLLA